VQALPEAEKQVSVGLSKGGTGKALSSGVLQAYGCLAVAVYICWGTAVQHHQLVMCFVTVHGLKMTCWIAGVSSQAAEEGCCHSRRGVCWKGHGWAAGCRCAEQCTVVTGAICERLYGWHKLAGRHTPGCDTTYLSGTACVSRQQRILAYTVQISCYLCPAVYAGEPLLLLLT
jgi:hypothetical protein